LRRRWADVLADRAHPHRSLAVLLERMCDPTGGPGDGEDELTCLGRHARRDTEHGKGEVDVGMQRNLTGRGASDVACGSQYRSRPGQRTEQFT